MFLDSEEDILKVLYGYLYQKCVRNRGSRRGLIGGSQWFLTGDLEEKVNLDIMDNDFSTFGRYPVSLM